MASNRFQPGSRSQWGRRSSRAGYPGHQGRGRGGRGGLGADSKPAIPPPLTTQRLLQAINNDQLPSASCSDDISIDNCEYIASYNWLEKLKNKEAAILIPGSPPAWRPPVEVPSLHQDSGAFFRDPNAARFPTYPTEPAVRALYGLKPQFDGSSIDIVACGNTLGSLLSFASSLDRTFRIGVENVGGTLFLIRTGNSARELIDGVYGYGHSFPEAYTSWDTDVRGSSSHQRLIGYKFGGLRFLIRSETDGYLPDKLLAPTGAFRPPDSRDIDVSSLNFSVLSPETVSSSKGLNLDIGGRSIPQAAIFDLKTRSAHREINMNEILPRLWVNQTPNFIIGYHNQGRFDDIRIKDVREELKSWEKQNQGVLRQLCVVLRELIKIASAHKGGKLEVRRTGEGKLEVWTGAESREVLPEELKRRWTVNQESGQTNEQKGKSACNKEAAEDSEEDDDYLAF